jgi:membrane protease YdiL (CAAX protease family)
MSDLPAWQQPPTVPYQHPQTYQQLAPVPAPDPNDPRHRPQPVARAVAWLVIIASVAFVITAQYWPEIRGGSRASVNAGPAAMQQFQLEFASRYAVGAHALFEKMKGAAGQDPGKALADQLRQQAQSNLDHFKLAIVLGELRGPDAALHELDTVHAANAAATEPTTKAVVDIAEGLPAPAKAPSGKPDEQDLQILRTLYESAGGASATTAPSTAPATRATVSLSGTERDRMISRYGWYGSLVASFGRPDSDPVRSQLLFRSMRTMFGVVGFFVIMGILLLVGLVLLIVGIVMYFSGTLRLVGPMRWVPRQPFLETFAVYLPVFFALSLLLAALKLHSLAWDVLLTPLILPIAWLWPKLRGVTARESSAALGYFTGRGVFREIGCGFVGYIAGLPVVGCGLLIMLALRKLSHVDSTPYHPLLGEIGKVNPLLIYLVASVWAPVMEETFFRGALFHHLRTRWGWWPSALLVSLIFAAIHPQGWTFIPLLGAIAMVLAGIREWRGSIIAPMTAHGLTNFMTATLLLMTMS